MAKLLGARIAWAAADNALQIHGGNGFCRWNIRSRAFVRRAHPQYFRRRRGNPGAGDRAAAAGRRQLRRALAREREVDPIEGDEPRTRFVQTIFSAR